LQTHERQLCLTIEWTQRLSLIAFSSHEAWHHVVRDGLQLWKCAFAPMCVAQGAGRAARGGQAAAAAALFAELAAAAQAGDEDMVGQGITGLAEDSST
jgi:hypothetical protein